ncbi:hypothetical protein B296_00029786 [Ensete ventricosum]|uniref:Uncharacterized protein n=1 Tax=Ensete ventricosum TaxID=4639 RepID=A0A427AEK3_ENSVE|nr:hypothetical protein B296_00029786 [Ensete ventricosum]
MGDHPLSGGTIDSPISDDTRLYRAVTIKISTVINRLQCVELDKEPEEPKIDLIDLQFYNEHSESSLEWVEMAENQEDPLLDKAGDPQRPSCFITETIKEEKAHSQQVENPLSQNVAE